jgi:hypothetical protein
MTTAELQFVQAIAHRAVDWRFGADIAVAQVDGFQLHAELCGSALHRLVVCTADGAPLLTLCAREAGAQPWADLASCLPIPLKASPPTDEFPNLIQRRPSWMERPAPTPWGERLRRWVWPAPAPLLPV